MPWHDLSVSIARDKLSFISTMSKKNKNKISIPIVKNGKDICRLIFTKDENMPGCYDLKINMQKNPYEVWAYRLFARYPVMWDVDDSENVSMSYHHGANEAPIMIHLKDELSRGAAAYKTLPVKNILAPNTDTMFPIPLCKLEIPEIIVEHAAEYKKKSYHHTVDTGEMNILEFYMVSDDFDLENFWSEKYSTISLCQMGLSMEYFASYTVLSDYEKDAHFMPEHGAEERALAIKGLQGMTLMVTKYQVPEINTMWDKLHMTLIENRFAEDMLLCTLVRYPKVNLHPNQYDAIFMGSASVEQLKPPPGPLAKLPVLPESCVDRDLNRYSFLPDERKKLEDRAGLARARMFRELRKHEEFIHEQGEYYRKKAYEFRTLMSQVQIPDGCAWHSFEIHMLFARYVGLREYSMQLQRFYKRDDRDIMIDHVWLRIDDYFEIDILRDALSTFVKSRGERTFPVLVTRSRFYVMDDPWDGMRQRLEENGYICESPKWRNFKEKDIRQFFCASHGVYENIYERICALRK